MAHEDPLRRVVGVRGDRVFETWCKNNVAMCIITTATNKEPAICSHPMLQHFRKLGIVPRPLARPAVVSDKDAEWNLVLTKEFRMKSRHEAIAAAIGIAHLRAISQCIESTGKWAWIMEEDAELTSHFATGVMAGLLALSGSASQQDNVAKDPPMIMFLCGSTHATRQMNRVTHAKPIWQLRPNWGTPGCPELRCLTPNEDKRSQWVGQGARGYILHPSFAEHLLEQPIGNYWDLHMITELQKYKGYAVLVFPMPLCNIIYPAQPCRGSSRLQSFLGKKGEDVTDYILISLDKGWGLWNRVRSIVWAIKLADFHRVGLFVLWKVASHCDMDFDKIFPSFAEKVHVLYSQECFMPFVKILSYEEEGQRTISVRNNMYCLGELRCQASVSSAMKHFENIMSNHMLEHSLGLEEMDLTPLWKLFEDLNDQAVNAATDYLQRCENTSTVPGAPHIAIHCRRNDISKVIQDRHGKETLNEIDGEMWNQIEGALVTNHNVHFITDDTEYCKAAYEKFHDRIFYGLHWDSLKDTKPAMCKRSTPLQYALDEFAIMQKCCLVYGHKSSSACDWLEQVCDGFCYFETANDVEWHGLSNKARADITHVVDKLFHLHYTGWHLLADVGKIYVPMMQLAILRKLTDQNYTALVNLFEKKGFYPNDGQPRFLADIGQWIIDAVNEGDDSMLPIVENRKEYRNLTEEGTKPQGWLAVLMRITFYDFLVSQFNVITHFFDSIPAQMQISFLCDKNETYPILSWAQCREVLRADKKGIAPWKKHKSM